MNSPNPLKIQLIKIIRIKNKTHNHIGCGFQSYGDGGSSLKRLSIHLKIAINIVVSMFTLSIQLCVKC